jgi:Kef-type K+ transport system membrane component KefB
LRYKQIDRVLLALVVALLNSSGGIEALYVFLTAVAFSLFIIFIVRPLYRKLCVVTNSFENGPSHLLMTVTLMIVLLSAFVTDIIGITETKIMQNFTHIE